jgi:hypothetical protein
MAFDVRDRTGRIGTGRKPRSTALQHIRRALIRSKSPELEKPLTGVD